MTKRKPGSTQRYRHVWTPEEDAVLTSRYPDERAQAIADDLKLHVTQIYKRAKKLGLSKSEAFYVGNDSGRTGDGRGAGTRFQSGHVPWSKGTKGLTGTHPNCRKAQYKKGRPAADARNYVPIGTEKVKDGYLCRTVTDDPSIVPAQRWTGVHRIVWEQANGPIPDGYVVCFREGRFSTDVEKITIDALELVHRAEMARRNHPRSKDPELAKLVQLKGAITRQVNRIAREAKEKQS
ncbi:HNH endonuclease signature motif containing protein [Paraburkholderia sp. SOS3]|uniref:HNH endonuclease signature motif containing protein n=1 Tax=Paraburkholderia sp. SOS3 TaxID=1926494 RepID=UPI0009475AB1|nr:HNH endonuclease signature motif containing protein [Paraburkholderia sp. SOS3]APR39989.1 HNH endonuclease [Paraburkholderia sp. SOS3]